MKRRKNKGRTKRGTGDVDKNSIRIPTVGRYCSVTQRNSAATPLMLRVWATKKGPLRCATAPFSGFWAVFAAKSAVARRSGTNSALTLQKFGAKKAPLAFRGVEFCEFFVFQKMTLSHFFFFNFQANFFFVKSLFFSPVRYHNFLRWFLKDL
jgi:hypothetical protein